MFGICCLVGVYVFYCYLMCFRWVDGYLLFLNSWFALGCLILAWWFRLSFVSVLDCWWVWFGTAGCFCFGLFWLAV